MYGATPPKIAVMLGIEMDAAERVINAFWDSNPGLKARREWLEKFWEATGRKYIPAFDGRKVHTRSKHSLLNAYQQSGGAVLMDLAGILLHWELVKRGWYDDGVRRVIYYHDEYQLQVPNKYRKVWEFDTLEETDKFYEDFSKSGKMLSGRKYYKVNKDTKERTPILNSNGKIELVYCPVGEMVVRCIERAAKIMGAPIHITGDYLTGDCWAGTH